MDFSVSGVAQSCCPVSSRACAGCSSYSQGKCQSCAEGFLLREGACTACSSAGGWLSQDGKSCFQLEASECNDVKVRGQSSKEACCQCGGGVVTPTPFSYPSRRWSLDSEIVLMPEPRTAERYTVDAQCELAMHNLTMDSSTGKIFYMPGRSKPLEAFAFECEVTAHEAPGVILASVVTVAADLLSYSSATLLFHSGAAPEVPLVTGAGWSKFELGCAPEVAWLGIDAQTGALSFLPQGSAAGGISVADDKFYGQDGAVCAVTAWQAKKQHKASFVSIRPRPWSAFEYDLAAVAVSIGEELHPLLPKSHTEQGLMKPWTYNMACDVSGADAQVKFSFDRVLSMGLLAGHPILDIGPEGEITVAPSPSLGPAQQPSYRTISLQQAVTLDCRVFGIFPDPALPPVETSLSIEVQDTVCWVPQSVKAGRCGV
ncbi:unnamed protein product [Symbiodinium sp. CCMP2592]|nr:unnamed protein product [Symbiodinium sp. CCMP2592]